MPRGGRLVLGRGGRLVNVSLATRGQTDMRGLGTAGRCFRRELDRVSRVERREPVSVGLVAHRSGAGRSKRCYQPLVDDEADQGSSSPRASPGTSTSRRARGRCPTFAIGVLFAALGELHPPVVESPVAFIAADPRGCGGEFPALAHGLAYPVLGPVVPGGLDQQPAHVGVAGLGDRPLDPGAARGMLGAHQPDEGADAWHR